MNGTVRPRIWLWTTAVVILLLVLTLGKISSADQNTKSNFVHAFACDGSYLNISCPQQRYSSVLNIIYANYGRSHKDICDGNKTNAEKANWRTTCRSNQLEKVRAKCQGREGCNISANSEEFVDRNFCRGTPTYLEVRCHCLPGPCKVPGESKYPADSNECVSAELKELYNELQMLKSNFSADGLQNLTIQLESWIQRHDLSPDVIWMLTTMIADAVNLMKNISNERISIFNKINELVISSTSHLLSDAVTETWDSLSQSNQSVAATRLLTAVEDSSALLAMSIHEATNITRSTPGLTMQLNVLNLTEEAEGKGLEGMFYFSKQSNSTEESFGISLQDIKSSTNDGLGRVTFVLYNNIDRYLQPGNVPGSFSPTSATESMTVNRNGGPFINTKVISASIVPVGDTKSRVLTPVQYTLNHKKKKVSYSTCVFWSYSKKTYEGIWSSDGCEVVNISSEQTTCTCNHLTNFAVLMSPTSYEVSIHHKSALQLITYIGCSISIVCLVLAFITFCCFKNLQCDRNTIHKNLVFCLCIAEIIFIFGIDQTQNTSLCQAVTMFLHYFFLASFAWMFIEGVQLYIMLIEVFDTKESRLKWYYLGGYGMPALTVITTIAVNFGGHGRGYETENYCWLSVKNGFIWAFTGPAAAIITVNTIVLGIAIYTMRKHKNTAASMKKEEKSTLGNIGSFIRGSVVLMVLLGTTWFFGLLHLNAETVFMAYIFTILNSLQGLFIFIFHCLMHEKVQKEYQGCIQRATWLPESFRQRYGGFSGNAALSTEPNQSTSSGVPMFFRMLRSRKQDQNLSSSSTQKSTMNSSDTEQCNTEIR